MGRAVRRRRAQGSRGDGREVRHGRRERHRVNCEGSVGA